MKYLHNFINKEEKKSFINDLGLLKRPAVISYDNTEDVDFYDEKFVRFKHVIPENAINASPVDDGNTYKLCSDGYIYDSFKINGVEMAKPLGEIKNSGIMPAYIEEEHTTTLTIDSPLPVLNREEISCFFENDFDVENGFLYLVIRTYNQYIIYNCGQISAFPNFSTFVKSINSKQIVFNSYPLVHFIAKMKDMTIEDYTEEEINSIISQLDEMVTSYNMAFSVYFSNSSIGLQPSADEAFSYDEINDLFEGKTIPVSGTYTYKGMVYPDIFTDDVNYSHDLIIKFTKPIDENILCSVGPYDYITFSGLMDFGVRISEDLMTITLSPILIDMLVNSDKRTLRFNDSTKTGDRITILEEIPYEVEYRSGGVPANIYTNLDPATYDIVATIDPIYYKENVNTYISNSFYAYQIENYTGGTVSPSLPKCYYNFGGSNSTAEIYTYPYCTEVTLPGDIYLVPSYFAYENEYLTSVTIGESVREIEGGAFYKCSSLKKITCHAVICPEVNQRYSDYYVKYINGFSGLPDNGVLQVPEGSDYSRWLRELPSGWVIEYI